MINYRISTYSAMTGLYLCLAVLLEVAGTTSMKLSDGFNNILPSVLIFVFYTLSFVFLTLTLKRMEVSVVYAIWSGLGTLAIATIGMVFFHEPVTIIKILSLLLIIAGVVGLKLG
jgi:small multidrug resistance pump